MPPRPHVRRGGRAPHLPSRPCLADAPRTAHSGGLVLIRGRARSATLRPHPARPLVASLPPPGGPCDAAWVFRGCGGLLRTARPFLPPLRPGGHGGLSPGRAALRPWGAASPPRLARCSSHTASAALSRPLDNKETTQAPSPPRGSTSPPKGERGGRDCRHHPAASPARVCPLRGRARCPRASRPRFGALGCFAASPCRFLPRFALRAALRGRSRVFPAHPWSAAGSRQKPVKYDPFEISFPMIFV